jgi:hypothetical protein
MKKFLVLALAAISFCAVAAHAQVGPTTTVVPFNGQNNPCANPSIVKSHLLVNLTAGTAQLVAPVTGKKIHVCSLVATFAGTTPALTFLYGTQTTTACDTGAANLSGTFLPTSGTFVNMTAAEQGAIVLTPASQQLCALTAGSVQGVLLYVQM